MGSEPTYGPLHSGAEDGKHGAHRASGVRVALRAPAARTELIVEYGDGWPGARPQRYFRAHQRLLGASRGGSSVEGEGRADRARAVGAALGELNAGPSRSDPACQLCARATRHASPQDHPSRCLRARRLDLPVLRVPLQPDSRPCDPALEGGNFELGQHRGLMRTVQPAQGRHASSSSWDAPSTQAAHTARRDLHPRRQSHDSGGLAAVSAGRCLRPPQRLISVLLFLIEDAQADSATRVALAR
jgi:hypothetical protein